MTIALHSFWTEMAALFIGGFHPNLDQSSQYTLCSFNIIINFRQCWLALSVSLNMTSWHVRDFKQVRNLSQDLYVAHCGFKTGDGTIWQVCQWWLSLQPLPHRVFTAGDTPITDVPSTVWALANPGELNDASVCLGAMLCCVFWRDVCDSLGPAGWPNQSDVHVF